MGVLSVIGRFAPGASRGDPFIVTGQNERGVKNDGELAPEIGWPEKWHSLCSSKTTISYRLTRRGGA